MGLTPTIALALAAAALAASFGWLGARQPDPGKGPRLVPWRMLMALAAAATLVLVVHLVNLLGFATGR
jgi:hypothetical protein